MKVRAFSQRNTKEILRDPINLFFGIGFPIVLLLLLSAIQANIPDEAASFSQFRLDHLTPGIAVFGLSFITLFSATLVSKDRSTSFLMRLFSSPLTAGDYILGYILPLFPMAVAQIIVCFAVAVILGLEISVNILLVVAVSLPSILMNISMGLLFGTLFNDKQVGGICGALLTNVSAWLSGTWFSLKDVGGAFEKVANLLPFSHAVDAGRAALSGDYGDIFPHLWWVIGYAVVMTILAVVVFRAKMKE